jgi:SAM-dependent methyltransferase
VKAVGVVLYFWLVDDLYVPSYGRGLLNNLTGTPNYLSWLTRIVRPHLGDTVLEIGAGLGNLTGRLMGKRVRYVAAEKDPLYLHALRNRFLRTPHVTVCELDPELPADYQSWREQFASAMCVNLLESSGDPQGMLRSLATVLTPGGRLIVLAPQGKALFGTLDKAMGHLRRFSVQQLRETLEPLGFTIESEHQVNKIGAVGWWFSSRVLGRKSISRVALKLWDKSVWLLRLIDPLLPWNGLSVVVVARLKPLN